MAKKKRLAKIKICHPEPCEPVPPSFVAFGEAPAKILNVVGVAVSARGKVVLGRTLIGPPYWAIRFKKVPRGDAYLFVFDPAAMAGMAFTPFEVRIMRAAVGGLHIHFPANAAPRNFVSYGDGNVPSVTGTLKDSVPANTPGTTLEQPPDWSVQFSVAGALHNTYRVTVNGTGGATDFRDPVGLT